MDLRNKLVLLLVLLAAVSCSRSSKEKGYEIFPDMVHPVPYEAFSESKIHSDGKSMQLPPAGSIARGRMPFAYGSSKEEALRAGRELTNPYKETTTTLARGKEVYDQYCLVCHGVEGQGDGPIIPKFPNPPSLTGKRIKAYKDGRLLHIIVKGSGDMPSHAEQIDRDDRWFLVQYVRYIQETFSKK